ncbi:MAG: hypothetical protein EP330_09530 [Deltaproteobacteria bacterium]|nr:MAG: hypothetical protein EP330_09530 [Deltaproteobacteria bacterium]
MRGAWIRRAVWLGLWGCAGTSPEPSADVSPAVTLDDLVARVDGLRLDPGLVADGAERIGGWAPAEWDGGGFDFSWTAPAGAGWRLPAGLIAGPAVARLRVRAAVSGQTLSVAGAEAVDVPTEWTVVDVPLAELDEELILVAGTPQQVEGDERALGVAVDWVEVFPKGVDGLTARASVLDVGAPSARDSLLAGWGTNEQSGDVSWAWTVGPEATLNIPASGDALDVDLRVRAYRWEGAAEAILEVLVNGDSVASLHPGVAWGTHRVAVPASALRAGDNTIALRPSPIASPAEVGDGKDQRELGVALERAVVTPRYVPRPAAGRWRLQHGVALSLAAPKAGSYRLSATGPLIGRCADQAPLSMPTFTLDEGCRTLEIRANDEVELHGLEWTP